MRRITVSLIYSTLAIILLTNCQNKKMTDEKTENTKQLDSVNDQANVQSNNLENVKADETLSFDSYTFAENLKNDNFFESENTDKIIELKDVGIISYLVSNNEVTLSGIFYNKEKNMAIPYNNRPPGDGAFVSQYYDKIEIKYDEEYKRIYSAGLSITLRDPKLVKKLKMYLPSESSRVYEYKIDGGVEPKYRMGFIDLVNVKGTFKGISPYGVYPNKIYEIEDAEIN